MKVMRLIYITLSAFLILSLAGCAGKSMSGIVVDKDGVGVPVVFINVKTETGIPVATATTDNTGVFRVDGLDGDKRYKLALSKEGFTDIEYNPEGTLEKGSKFFRILFEVFKSISGTVVGRDGAGIPEVLVEVKTETDTPVISTRTNENGVFRIDKLDGDRKYKLSFSKYEFISKNDIEYDLRSMSEEKLGSIKIQLDEEKVKVIGRIMKPYPTFEERLSSQPAATVSSLQGDKKDSRLLFIIDPAFKDDLDKNILSVGLMEQFRGKDIIFTQNVKIVVEQQGVRWWLIDSGLQKSSEKVYVIKNELDRLNVYEAWLLPFIGLKVRLMKQQLDKDKPDEEVVFKETGNDGKFEIEVYPDPGREYRIEIQREEEKDKYTLIRYIPSESYFSLKVGEIYDIGDVVIDLSKSTNVDGTGIEKEKGPGYRSAIPGR